MRFPRLRHFAPVLVVTSVVLAIPLAHAAPGDTVRHSASTTGHVATDSSQVLPKWTPAASVAIAYVREPGNPTEGRAAIDARFQTDLMVAFGIAGWAQIEAAMPTVLHQRGTTFADDRFVAASGAAAGDLRLGARGTVLRTPRRGFGLGVGLDATVPTGSRAALTTYDGPTFTPTVLGEYRGPRGILLSTNLGYAVRPEVNIGTAIGGDAFVARLAARVPLAPREVFSIFAEVDTAASLVRGGDNPVAARGGFRWQTRGGLVMHLWGGGGVSTALGLPRVQLGLSAGFAPRSRVRNDIAFAGNERPTSVELARGYDQALLAAIDAPPEAPPPHPSDPDRDGVHAQSDLCPTVPEDRDGTHDDDGCPELDDDRDGIPDVVDLCPSAPEIVNGYRDLDGCPDRRLADGRGQTFETFDARRLLPALHFPPGSAAIDAKTGAELDQVAELLRLNPWIERLQLTVFVPQSADPSADRRLAQARAQAVQSELDARGVARWRIEALPAKSVPTGTAERVRLTLSGRARALDPVAPRPATLERIIAEAQETDTAGPDTLEAQGPESTQPDSPR